MARTLVYATIAGQHRETRMSITLVVTLVLASSGVCSALTMLAYARLPERRLHRLEQRKSLGKELGRKAILNAVVSTSVVFALTHLFAGRLFTDATPTLLRGGREVLGILALYDVLYYFMHRFLFHQWSALRLVHAVHHRVRYPTTIDSLFLHPLEGVMGLSLLMLCVFIVGPVHVVTFGVCFFVYSWVNIIIHAGVDFPIPYLGLVSRKHARHHVDMKAWNYASLTPIPDLIFGTAE
jgi:sterol desaturase/sphingolipid hydroxylase (fatty acid hydroxylase superfamily)